MAESKTEKMKKLFADKTLDAEQMDGIVGGALEHCGGGGDDSRFLNVLLRGHPDQCDRYGEMRAMYETESIGAEVTKAWAAVGITCKAYTSGRNQYYDNRWGISQEEAMKLAMQRMGKQLKKSDWYWE